MRDRIPQLNFQHAGVGMDARVGRACRNFSFTEGGSIAFAITVVEQLHGLDRGGNILWPMIKKCAYGNGNRLQSSLLLQHLGQQESGGHVTGLRLQDTAQGSLGIRMPVGLLLDTGESETQLD